MSREAKHTSLGDNEIEDLFAFTDDQAAESEDGIRPLLDYVNNKMPNNVPAFTPIKRGFKVWAIACSQTGFVFSIEVYTGAKGGNPELLLGEKVVVGMCSLFIKKGTLGLYRPHQYEEHKNINL
ncbi:hypothetical protein J6590_015510 [Homalodisca vitripennis]|nr:hypothetical protein J6590_015510 [Homalodisca vitripennis]